MDTRTSFLWISVCVCLVSGESVISVSGEVGSTVVLPCKLETVGTETPHIRWTRESEIVFERKGTEFYQGKGYEGRVDVPAEELCKGNCSLVLRNLTSNDSGVYTSTQVVRRTKRNTEGKKISSVYLSVREKPIEVIYEMLNPTDYYYDYEVYHKSSDNEDLYSEPMDLAGFLPLWFIILLGVCSVSILINIISMCVFCSRKQDNSITNDWNEKEVLLQHTPEWTCVTYTSRS